MVVDIDIVLSTQLISAVEAQIIVIRNHSALENLEYESSGHIGFASQQYVDENLDLKVNKEAGKGLSTNDFSNTYKTQVDENKSKILTLETQVIANKSDIETIETQLALYQFTRHQIVSKFLEEYSSYVGVTVTAENYVNAPRQTHEFLTYKTSWHWLKQWLIACRTNFEQNQIWLSTFLGGNETFWSYEMKAFLMETYLSAYPGSTDYTQENYANGWRPSSTIEELDSRVSALELNKAELVEQVELSSMLQEVFD